MPSSRLSVPICPSVTFSEKPMKFDKPPPLRVSAAAPDLGAIKNKGSASTKIRSNNPTATIGRRVASVLHHERRPNFLNTLESGGTSKRVSAYGIERRAFWISKAVTADRPHNKYSVSVPRNTGLKLNPAASSISKNEIR